MNKKRTLLYLLFIIITVIFVYNYVISPALSQNVNNSGITMGKGMGMHGTMYNYSTDYTNNNNNMVVNNYIQVIYYFILFILLTMSLVIINKLFPKSKSKSCKKCGYKIEDSNWRKCPICGNNLDS